MSGRSSTTQKNRANLCRIAGHGAARMRHRVIVAWLTGPVPSTSYSRQARRWTKQLCAAGNRPIQPQPRRVRTIVANVAAKSP